MEVTAELIEKLATLSKLSFNEQEKQAIRGDLQKMINFIQKLQEVDTDQVEPLIHMVEQVNVLRKDRVAGSISREEALSNAPEHDAMFFKVPKMIRKEQ